MPAKFIVLDLDGPIFECKWRHHRCYADIAAEEHLSHIIDAGEYWKLKRNRISNAQIFRMTGATDEERLARRWVERVELPSYLELDRVQEGVRPSLDAWVERGTALVLATLRRNAAGLEKQLLAVDLTKYFHAVVVCAPSEGAAGKAAAVLARLGPLRQGQNVWIGDTEVDAQASQIAQCEQLFLVTCGIRTESFLWSLELGEVVRDLPAVSSLLR